MAESPSPQARTPRSRKSRSSSSRSAVFQPSTRPIVSFQQWSTNDASGFVLGALAWILVIQYLNGGVPGVKNWLRAKFLNKDAKGNPLP